MSKDREKSIEKRLDDKNKLDAEIQRSLSVVEMKKAHKQIEEIEKERKKSIINSVIQRIDYNIQISAIILDVLTEHNKKELNQPLTMKDSTKNYVDTTILTYESIKFDLQKNMDINLQDFERIFPKIELPLDTFASVIPYLNCLKIQMNDLKLYCARLL